MSLPSISSSSLSSCLALHGRLVLALERGLDRLDGPKWLVVHGELGRLDLGDGEVVRDVRRRRVHRPGGGERVNVLNWSVL